MIRISIFLVVIFSTAISFQLTGQVDRTTGFDREDSVSMGSRWIKAQPAIVVQLDSGIQLYGQPIHTTTDTLYLYPATGFPVGIECFKDILPIPYSHMDRVLLQRGGNSVSRAKRSVRLQVPDSDLPLSSTFQSVRKAAVYSDSPVQPEELGDAFPHSKVLRQAFPDKHFRISIGFGIDGNRATKDAEEAIEQSPLPYPTSSYGNRVTLDFLDLSWRFQDRVIVGGQLSARGFSYTIYGDNYGETEAANFSYDLFFMEHRVYAEYAFFHVNRYFTRRFELLTGAGFLMGRPDVTVYYSYNDFSDLDNPIYESISSPQEGSLNGFQLRGTFHYYFFPGFSIWTGLEANLYKPWVYEALELPTSDPDAPVLLQEHTLNFSGIRVKFGVSIYL